MNETFCLFFGVLLFVFIALIMLLNCINEKKKN